MNFATAALVIYLFLVGASDASSDNLRRTADDNDVVVDNGPDTMTNEEYEALVEYRISVVAFWDKTRVSLAQPRYRTVDDAQFIELESEEDAGSEDDGARKLQNVENDPWENQGDAWKAAGRLFFEMGSSLYRCSATAITDGSEINGRSIILTAGHCVYDDDDNKFATKFLFIPAQDDRGGDRSDDNCYNDQFGCWTPQYGVVDNGWASRNWENNIPNDYAYLVVNDAGSHQGGRGNVSDALDNAVPALDVDFQTPNEGELAYGLGYPASHDSQDEPADFRYCRQDLGQPDRPQYAGYKLDGCGLTGGASGGPWIQIMDSETGRGKVIAVNSYGPSSGNRRYMGGPKLHSNSAECLYKKAKEISESEAGRGIIVTYNSANCDASTFVSEGGVPSTTSTAATAAPGATTTTAIPAVTTTTSTTTSTTTTTTTTPPSTFCTILGFFGFSC